MKAIAAAPNDQGYGIRKDTNQMAGQGVVGNGAGAEYAAGGQNAAQQQQYGQSNTRAAAMAAKQ